jgi:hypothetical protein
MSSLKYFGSGDIVFSYGWPGLKQRLRLVPGRSYRARAHGRVRAGFVRVGSHSAELHYTLVGLESKQTPAGSWHDALRVEERLALRATVRGSGSVVESVENSIDWYVEGVGWVASRYDGKTWQDGALVEEVAPTDVWVVEGVVGGAPLQLPPP